MQDYYKRGFYVLVIICIIGIIAVGAVRLFGVTSKEGYSDLYISDYTNLPKSLDVGEELNFIFVVISHEMEKMTYWYEVNYDGRDIQSGSFSLKPEQIMTINTKLIPNNSSLKIEGDPAITVRRMKYNNLVVSEDKILLPLKIQGVGLSEYNGILIFDPALKEFYATNYTSVKEMKITDSDNPENLRYYVIHDSLNITNNYGAIDVQYKNSSQIFGYIPKKTTVKVYAFENVNPSLNDSFVSTFDKKKALHWMAASFEFIVKEKPDVMQNISNNIYL